ncbi:MAG: rRNA maturation RNase YbeY [Erysipelothrix sp.]|nr:rRNA maturation RNase YbeY [Erysipelothrix sp.]
MEINIYDYVNFEQLSEKRYEAIFQEILKVLDKQGDYSLSLSLVSADRIKEINNEYRNINAVTDVLSFEVDYEILSDEIEIDLGDIFICLERASEQAIELKQSLDRELEFLFIHGVLHLFGYDHIEKEDEVLMLDLQRKIVNEIY